MIIDVYKGIFNFIFKVIFIRKDFFFKFEVIFFIFSYFLKRIIFNKENFY